ncbi:hypothetical protein ACP70R_036258 [Stipagrostis hirtigluma subsp. patula]
MESYSILLEVPAPPPQHRPDGVDESTETTSPHLAVHIPDGEDPDHNPPPQHRPDGVESAETTAPDHVAVHIPDGDDPVHKSDGRTAAEKMHPANSPHHLSTETDDCPLRFAKACIKISFRHGPLSWRRYPLLLRQLSVFSLLRRHVGKTLMIPEPEPVEGSTSLAVSSCYIQLFPSAATKLRLALCCPLPPPSSD